MIGSSWCVLLLLFAHFWSRSDISSSSTASYCFTATFSLGHSNQPSCSIRRQATDPTVGGSVWRMRQQRAARTLSSMIYGIRELSIIRVLLLNSIWWYATLVPSDLGDKAGQFVPFPPSVSCGSEKLRILDLERFYSLAAFPGETFRLLNARIQEVHRK